MRREIAAMLSTACLLVGGCSTEHQAQELSPAPTVAAAASKASTDSSQSAAASVGQWASHIMQIRAGLDDSQESWDDATCSATILDGAADCQALLIAMTNRAQAAAITLGGLGDDLGEPPAEVASLVDQSIAAADEASAAGESVDCTDSCIGTGFTFLRAWDDMLDTLAGWDAY